MYSVTKLWRLKFNRVELLARWDCSFFCLWTSASKTTYSEFKNGLIEGMENIQLPQAVRLSVACMLAWRAWVYSLANRSEWGIPRLWPSDTSVIRGWLWHLAAPPGLQVFFENTENSARLVFFCFCFFPTPVSCQHKQTTAVGVEERKKNNTKQHNNLYLQLSETKLWWISAERQSHCTPTPTS